MQKRMITTRQLVMLALMVALNVVLGRLSPQITKEIRFSVLGFIPIALSGWMMGPLYGLLTGAAGDILNYFLYNQQYGPLFPGYTLVAALSGLWYALVLYKKECSWLRAVLCIVPVIVVGEMFLNSVWTYILYPGTFWAKLPLRLLVNAIECPVKIALLMGVMQLMKRMPKELLKL
ncbi:MAG: folate family ECF transporter S component [Aristaeellaceae bacterium]